MPSIEAPRSGGFDHVASPGPVHSSGQDDELARLASDGDTLTAVVTADRGLRGRLPTSVLALSPSTVLGWLD